MSLSATASAKPVDRKGKVSNGNGNGGGNLTWKIAATTIGSILVIVMVAFGNDAREHFKSDGHPVTLQRIKAVEDRLEQQAEWMKAISLDVKQIDRGQGRIMSKLEAIERTMK